MRTLAAALLCALSFSCSGNTEHSAPTDDTRFGTTPEAYFPRPAFEVPEPTDCVASTKADADYSCEISFTAAGAGVADVTTLSFDRWGKLVLSEGSESSEFEYDCAGSLIRATSGAPGEKVEVVHTYTEGRLVQTVATDELQGSTDTTDYTYDADGRILSVTTTWADSAGATESETVVNEYDAGGNLTRAVSTDGSATDYWTDEDGVEWRGDRDGDGCKFGTLNDSAGNWIEDHVLDCPAFGEGHRIVKMERDEHHRPLQVTSPSGHVTETHVYDGVNPYPTSSWREYVDSALGAETANFEYTHTLTSLTVTAVIAETGKPGGTVTFEGVPCLPDEAGLRLGWLLQLAVP